MNKFKNGTQYVKWLCNDVNIRPYPLINCSTISQIKNDELIKYKNWIPKWLVI